MNKLKRYKLIACEIMFREICSCAASCKNIIDITFMPKGLHDIGQQKMSSRLQNEIDSVDTEKYDAILLCYGLCNNGVKGLHSNLPIIIPRAHDCITLLLGSRDRYNEFFNKNPGTFYKSPGWVERDADPNKTEQSITSQLGMSRSYQEYVDKYGEENALYLMEMLGDWFKNYKKITYINTLEGDFDGQKELAKQQANKNNWEYEEVPGNTRLIFNLLNGIWDDEDFMVLPPNSIIEPSYKENIIECKPYNE